MVARKAEKKVFQMVLTKVEMKVVPMAP